MRDFRSIWSSLRGGGILQWMAAHSRGAIKTREQAIAVLLILSLALVMTALNARPRLRQNTFMLNPKIKALIADEIAGKTRPSKRKPPPVKWDLPE